MRLGGSLAWLLFHSTLHAPARPLIAPATQPLPLHFPWRPLAQLLLLWLVFAAFQLGKEAVPRCSWRFALLFGCSAALGLGLAAAFARQATRHWQPEQGGSADPASQPILPSSTPNSAEHAACAAATAGGEGWTARQLAGAMTVALLGGGLGGMVGLGGGMLLSPLFLELGAHPAAASATSGLLVLFSSSIAVLSFGAAGRLPLPWAAVFGPACLAAAFVGTFIVGRWVRRSGRASALVLLLACIMGAGAAVTAAVGGAAAVAALAGRASWDRGGGGEFCD